MDSKPVEAFLGFLKTDASWFLSAWYAVITRGEAALTPAELSKPDTLLYALRFLFYVMVFGFIMEVPVAALLELPYDKPAYVASSLALNCALWLGYAVILHATMRAAGGRAELQQSLSICCFASAWLIPAMVLQWPLQRYGVQTLARGQLVSIDLIEAMSRREIITLAAASVISTAFLVYFLGIVLKALRRAHQLPRWRALSALSLGIVGVIFVVFVFSFPIHQILYNAFT